MAEIADLGYENAMSAANEYCSLNSFVQLANSSQGYEEERPQTLNSRIS